MVDGARQIDVATQRRWLADGGEVAFIDVREEGEHCDGHPLLSVHLPYSRLELDIARLVPRPACRVVLIDSGDGVAARAAARLAGLGYGDVSVAAGGVAAWAAAHPLFPSSNVPSKGFAELVEIDRATPHVTAAELDRLRHGGTKVAVLDSRTVEEFNRFHVPGAVSCPGAELVHRFADLVPGRDTLVVVSCAGRTRSIIGAQSLINAGVPNRVVSLQGGTQGWRLAGLELERDTRAALGPVSSAAAGFAAPLAARIAERFGVWRIDRATLMAWRADPRRTTHLLDVRTPEEFAAGHLPGAESAAGGQLVQAIDRWVATRGARLVLVDDTETRAIMTAHWLIQMGWDAVVLEGGIGRDGLETGNAAPVASEPQIAGIAPVAASQAMTEGAAAIVLGPSAAYSAAHPAGAVWTIRPRLGRLPESVLGAGRIMVFADSEPEVMRLAAAELGELTGAEIALVDGGVAGWQKAGLPVVATPGNPPDSERIDFVFWNHDRHTGNQAAMRAYLQWELDLPGEIARDGLAGFQLAP
ncbi:MAG: rhodanese-like domain-containing protein [Stellaceae bacterium]